MGSTAVHRYLELALLRTGANIKIYGTFLRVAGKYYHLKSTILTPLL